MSGVLFLSALIARKKGWTRSNHLNDRIWPNSELLGSEFSAHICSAFWLRLQLVDATHWLNRSAGVSKFNVFLGRSFSLRATAFSRF